MKNAAPTKSLLQILSLEDSPHDFELIRELLIDEDYIPKMLRVETQTEFVKALQHHKFDVILADFNLPEFDTFTALEDTLAICPDVPFIVVSGTIGEETAIDLIKRGAVDYVLKDRPRRLISAIERALGEAAQKQKRNKLELELAENYGLLRIAGKAAKFGGWRVNLADNTCTWSDTVADIHEVPRGYSPPVEEAIHFYAPEWREEITRVFNDCVNKGIPYDEEMEIITQKGNRVWVRTIGRPIQNADGDTIQVHGAFQDISDRKQAEEALRTSEALFSNSFEYAATGMTIATPLGRFFKVNQAFCDMLGYDKSELVEMHFADITHPDDVEEDLAVLARVISGEIDTFQMEKRYIKKSGEVMWVFISPSLVRDSNNHPLYAITQVVDITQRKKAESELRERESLLNKIFNVLPIGLWFADKTGKLIQGNPAGVKIWGAEPTVPMDEYDVFSARRLPSGEAITPDDWALAHTIRERVTITDELLEIDAFDGQKRIILNYTAPVEDEEGELLGAIVVNNDITNLRAAEENLRESEERFRELVVNLPGVVYLCQNDERYTMQYLNDEVQALTGYPKEAFLEDRISIIDLYHPDDLPAIVAGVNKAVEKHKSFHLEYRLKPKGGDYRWVEEWGTGIYDGHELRFLEGFFVDITEVKMAEERRQRRLAEMEALEKITETLRYVETIDKALPVLLQETLKALDVSAGGIYLQNAMTGKMEILEAAGWYERLKGENFLPNKGIVGQVFSEGRKHLSKEFASDPIADPNQPNILPHGWGGVCVPIQTLNETIGVFSVSCQLPRQIQPEEEQLLSAIAKIAGITLHRMSLFEGALNRLEKLEAKQKIDKAIASLYDLQMILEIIVSQAVDLLPADAVSVLIFEPHNLQLRYYAGSGFQTEAYKNAQVHIGKGYTGKAALEQSTLQLEHLEDCDPPFERQDLIADEQFLSYSAVPLIAKGQLKGVLEVFNRSALTHDLEWLVALESLASQTAIAIEDQNIYDRLWRNNLELTRAYDKTIEGWSSALDLRDENTEGHSLRVAETTVRLAQALGVDDEELVHIRRGALLHDMGKLGVPDSILLKPGKLTDAEWVVMKKHPQFAFNMLASIDYLRPALDIPYCHHEKWDGTGYPRGLKGTTIPLSARIFAVIDVFDALTSERPYREAWTRERALVYIQEQSGKHFDPQVVDVFVNQVRQG